MTTDETSAGQGPKSAPKGAAFTSGWQIAIVAALLLGMCSGGSKKARRAEQAANQARSKSRQAISRTSRLQKDVAILRSKMKALEAEVVRLRALIALDSKAPAKEGAQPLQKEEPGSSGADSPPR